MHKKIKSTSFKLHILILTVILVVTIPSWKSLATEVDTSNYDYLPVSDLPTFSPSEIVNMNIADFVVTDISDATPPASQNRAAVDAGLYGIYLVRMNAPGGTVSMTCTLDPASVVHFALDVSIAFSNEYKMYLYEVADDGTILAQVDACESLTRLSDTVIGNVGIVNDSTVSKKYMIYIEATVDSTETMAIFCAINETTDNNEANEHAANATEIVLEPNGITQLNPYWDTRVDSDWYRFQIPVDATYSNFTVDCYNAASIARSKDVFAVFKLSDDGSLDLVEAAEEGRIFAVSPGETYYVNAYNAYNSNISGELVGNYNLYLMPVGDPGIILTDYDGVELPKANLGNQGSRYLITDDMYLINTYVNGVGETTTDLVVMEVRNLDNNDYYEDGSLTGHDGFLSCSTYLPQVTGSRQYIDTKTPQQIYFYDHGQITVKKADGTIIDSIDVYLVEHSEPIITADYVEITS